MQESEREVIKRRIRALSAKTEERGCSEAEAMLAMKKIGDLLTQYNLSMDEVTMRQEKCVTLQFHTDSKKRNVIWHAFSGLQKFLGVKMWLNRPATWEAKDVGIKFSFFGLESDAEMGVYLAGILQGAEHRAAKEFKSSHIYKDSTDRRTATANFKEAFGQRICNRLYALADEREKAERQAADFHAESMRTKGFMVPATEEAKEAGAVEIAKATTGTALICIAKEKFVEEEFKRRGPKLRKQRASYNTRYDGLSRAAGAAAGDKVNLSRPLDGKKGPSGLLT